MAENIFFDIAEKIKKFSFENIKGWNSFIVSLDSYLGNIVENNGNEEDQDFLAVLNITQQCHSISAQGNEFSWVCALCELDNSIIENGLLHEEFYKESIQGESIKCSLKQRIYDLWLDILLKILNIKDSPDIRKENFLRIIDQFNYLKDYETQTPFINPIRIKLMKLINSLSIIKLIKKKMKFYSYFLNFKYFNYFDKKEFEIINSLKGNINIFSQFLHNFELRDAFQDKNFINLSKNFINFHRKFFICEQNFINNNDTLNKILKKYRIALMNSDIFCIYFIQFGCLEFIIRNVFQKNFVYFNKNLVLKYKNNEKQLELLTGQFFGYLNILFILLSSLDLIDEFKNLRFQNYLRNKYNFFTERLLIYKNCLNSKNITVVCFLIHLHLYQYDFEHQIQMDNEIFEFFKNSLQGKKYCSLQLDIESIYKILNCLCKNRKNEEIIFNLIPYIFENIENGLNENIQIYAYNCIFSLSFEYAQEIQKNFIQKPKNYQSNHEKIRNILSNIRWNINFKKNLNMNYKKSLKIKENSVVFVLFSSKDTNDTNLQNIFKYFEERTIIKKNIEDICSKLKKKKNI